MALFDIGDLVKIHRPEVEGQAFGYTPNMHDYHSMDATITKVRKVYSTTAYELKDPHTGKRIPYIWDERCLLPSNYKVNPKQAVIDKVTNLLNKRKELNYVY